MTDTADRIARLRKWATTSDTHEVWDHEVDVLVLCDDYETLAAHRDDLQHRLDSMTDVAWVHEHNCEFNRAKYQALAARADRLATAAHQLTFALIGMTKGEPPMYDLDAAIAEYDSARAEYRAGAGS